MWRLPLVSMKDSRKYTCIFPLSLTYLSSCLPSLFLAQEEQFLFPLLLLFLPFLPFLHNSLLSLLFILGYWGKEYAIRGQPSLWDKLVGEVTQTELALPVPVGTESGECCYRAGSSFFFFPENAHSLLNPSFCLWFFCPNSCTQKNENNICFG